MVNFIPKKLSTAEADLMRKEYGIVEAQAERAEAVWKELNEYFVYAEVSDDRQYYKDYFYWYTDLSWRFLQNQDYDFVTTVAVARQIPVAILLGYDVWKELMWYLAFKAELIPEMQAVYSRMKNALLNSQAIIGTWKENNFTMQDLVKEVVKLNSKEDSIAEAEFRNKLLQIYIPTRDTELQNLVFSDPSKAVSNLIGIVNFFLGVEAEKIWYIVDLYTHPEPESGPVQLKEGEVTVVADDKSDLVSKEGPKKVSPVLSNRSSIKTENSQSGNAVTEEVVRPVASFPSANEALKQPTRKEIKQQVESEFSKDTEGNFVEMEQVMTRLAELSEKYNDPEIADILYFDEQSGSFKWNI